MLPGLQVLKSQLLNELVSQFSVTCEGGETASTRLCVYKI